MATAAATASVGTIAGDGQGVVGDMYVIFCMQMAAVKRGAAFKVRKTVGSVAVNRSHPNPKSDASHVCPALAVRPARHV